VPAHCATKDLSTPWFRHVIYGITRSFQQDLEIRFERSLSRTGGGFRTFGQAMGQRRWSDRGSFNGRISVAVTECAP
jgi:hypothetical protein